jgi:hypothetical protein
MCRTPPRSPAKTISPLCSMKCTPPESGLSRSAPFPRPAEFEHKGEIVFAGERGGVRHIYMDGRPHPAHWAPTPAGHSVGRYEGDVLVVETVGMTAGNVAAGGLRTPETKLTERFEISADGRRMTITYTWDDPKIYQRPHTYQYFMERLPPGSYALEEWCDASDPVEQQSIVPPKQLE